MKPNLELIALGAFEGIVHDFRLLNHEPTRRETTRIANTLKQYLDGYSKASGQAQETEDTV